jgi:uncharacterized damage-inducible protein DinB
VPDLGYFRYLLAYTRWARDRVLDAASKLSEAEYLAPRGLDHGSIHSTLFHTLAAEMLWRRRWMGAKDARVIDEAVAPNLVQLVRLWLLEDSKIDAHLAALDESGLDQPVEYTNSMGVPFAEPFYLHLTQMVIHGPQHRSEVALALTQLGHSPGFLDFVAFVRERPPVA